MAQQQTTRQLSQIQSQTIGQLTALKKDSHFAWQSIQQSAHRQVKQAERLANEWQSHIRLAASQQLRHAHDDSQEYHQVILKNAQQQTLQAQRDSAHLRDIIMLHRPVHVLKQGYTMLTTPTGKQLLTSAAQLYPNQQIRILLKDGAALAQIDYIEHTNEINANNDNDAL